MTDTKTSPAIAERPAPTAVGSGDWLGSKICPGCGTRNPESLVSSCFSCAVCGWESDCGLKTIGEIMQGDWSKCDDVNLTKFLRTLLLPNVES